MSAALAPQLLGPVGGVRRPDLRLVPTGPEVRTPRLRVTRFGRLLLTVAALTLMVAVGVSVLHAQPASAGIDHTVTVRAGQTLSEIALRELPSLTPAEGGARIQLANHLNSADVHAGQQLAIPQNP